MRQDTDTKPKYSMCIQEAKINKKTVYFISAFCDTVWFLSRLVAFIILLYFIFLLALITLCACVCCCNGQFFLLSHVHHLLIDVFIVSVFYGFFYKILSHSGNPCGWKYRTEWFNKQTDILCHLENTGSHFTAVEGKGIAIRLLANGWLLILTVKRFSVLIPSFSSYLISWCLKKWQKQL